MSVKLFAAALAATTLISCAPSAPLTQAKTEPSALATQCEGRDGWSDPAPPVRIHGNSYYVGTCGIAVILIATPKGHILIDAATDEAVPSILANIRTLGFDPRDVKLIIGSHEHVDHMGGFAELKAATGAQLMVSSAARPSVETGRTDAADPQVGIIPDMKPVPVDGEIAFGAPMKSGSGSDIALTPHATPGHTSGGTSWTWRSCEGKKCITIAYVDSLSAVSSDDYKFSAHPERVAPFRSTFDRVRALPCDLLITPHPSFSDIFERLAGEMPLINPGACKTLADMMAARLDKRLASEAAK
ncbi:subclass B3 metallo-beta-lactamase [Sphingorhabdus sp.]|uniref:subclass B3 metallo-beta-lactamase n=1 Tax=Sphingorhabdus sp. TaxID=1902408 RepID=UPI003BB13A82|nr:subclass B3 metallo-beta-lactamase [Sphingomonadales bacterium]MBL0022342.1 subclass B3 metallo-beta-lactamase [Sphingomonadales bacterium]